MLQLRNIDFSYGPVQVLFDVHLDVRRGETLALLGTNGAGKSTVLRVVSGLGYPVTRCRAAERSQRDAVLARDAREVGNPPARRRQGDLRADVGTREPRDGRVLLPQATTRIVAARFDRALSIFPELATDSATPRGRCRAASSRCSGSRWR